MKSITPFKKLLILPTLLLSVPASHAAIIAYSTDFSDGDISGWSKGSLTTNDRDGTGGDGNPGDGALQINSQSDVETEYILGGSIDLGEKYTLELSTYNTTSSYHGGVIELYNADTGTVYSSSSFFLNGGSVGTQDHTLTYEAQAADVGDRLGIRVHETNNNGNRYVAIDTVSFTSVPEPSSSALLGLGGLALILRRRK